MNAEIQPLKPAGVSWPSLASRIMRYFRIYAALWRTSITREMSFKGNFILWIIVELLWFGLQLSFVSVVFTQTSQIGSWSAWEVVLLTGRTFDHRDSHCGNTQNVAGAVALDTCEVTLGAECGLRDDRPADEHDRQQSFDVTEHVVAGQREQYAPAVLVGACQRRCIRRPQHRVVGDQDPPWRTGGAGGVQHVAGIVGINDQTGAGAAVLVSEGGEAGLPRRLRKIILTLPTATPVRERRIMRARAESAGLRAGRPLRPPGSSGSGGSSPKLMFIGWKVVASAPPVMWPSRAPSAVVGGGGDAGRPNRSLAA